MLQRFKFIYIIFVFIGFTTSCKLFSSREDIPAYVNINNFNLDNSSFQSTNANNIVDVWVGTPNDELGVFTLPSVVPVLEFGDVILTFDAGIYVNGRTSEREKYYFYKTYVDTISIISNNQYEITPQFSYIKNISFSELGSDDFESSIRNYIADNDMTITFEESNDISFEESSAYLYNPEADEIELRIESKREFSIDNDKELAPVYLEFDLRASIDCNVGLAITEGSITQEFGVTSFFETKGEWKHMYVKLTDLVNLSSSNAEFKLIFNGTSTAKNEYIGLDNIRLMYLDK